MSFYLKNRIRELFLPLQGGASEKYFHSLNSKILEISQVM
jgi:hypothetical protein